MKILQVLLSPRIGGAESLADSLSYYWSQKGIVSKIVYIDPPGVEEKSRIGRIREIRQQYDSFDPDIVLSHSALPNIYCRLALPKFPAIVPVLHSSADDYSSISLRIAERTIRLWRRDQLVAVSEGARELYSNRFLESPPIKVIANGVSDPGLANLEINEPKSVATLARVAPVKNPWLWSDVAQELGRGENALVFDWLGPIEAFEGAEQITRLHSHGNVPGRLRGPSPNGPKALFNYDIYFHPSDREALGLSVIEAIMIGLPVITSEHVSNAVGKDLVAATFVAGDRYSAIEALRKVQTSYSDEVSKSVERREKALSEYGIEKSGNSYLQLFKRLLGLSD